MVWNVIDTCMQKGRHAMYWGWEGEKW